MVLLRGDLLPGDCVSCDQYVVPLCSCRYNTAGKERENDQYYGGTLFVDHASRLVTINHQSSLACSNTLVWKRILERNANQSGVRIKRYHADNGIFAAKDFRSDFELKGQSFTFSAANLHHQNGVAERYIQTFTRLARAMLLHSALHWPTHHSLTCWPMAMDHAVWIWNNLPMNDGLSPIEKFMSQKNRSYSHLRGNAHVWGSLCYVLDPRVVDNHKVPKWEPCSRQGKFLGYSKEHASNAGLILNPATGYLSFQYHVLYDDKFMSVPGVDENQRTTLQQVDWDTLIARQGESEVHYDEDDIDFVPNDLDDSWLTPAEVEAKRERRWNMQRNQVHHRHGAAPAPHPIERHDAEVIIIVNQHCPVQPIHQAPEGAAQQLNPEGNPILAENPIPAPANNPNPEVNNPTPFNNPINAARDQAEEGIGTRRTRSWRRKRPNQRFFNRALVNFSSHEIGHQSLIR